MKGSKSLEYAAFLRGINVGGHTLIKMADLKRLFEKMGLGSVRTLLASGNVVFESDEANEKALAKLIESKLKETFKKDIRVILRSLDDIKKLQSLEPFKGIKVTPSMRLYVTFLSEITKPRTLAIPFVSPLKEFRILQATPREVFSVLDLSKGKGTPDAMNIIEKEFGTNVTTRNWNIVSKLLA